MGMENYNPPQEPWLVVLYQDDQITAVISQAVCCLCRGVWRSTKTA